MAAEQPASNLQINPQRMWDSIMEMHEIDATEKGGNCRLTLSDGDKEGRELFRRWCEEAGLTVAVDSMGNMFARRKGKRDDLAPVAAGSHLDTQPTGGKFDGVLGVLSALELVRTLNDLDYQTERPIEIINWTNEEGSRFAPAMVSSGVFAGVFDQDFAYGRKDRDGKSLGDELERIGFKGDEKVGERKYHAFFEYHIEQGPILEDEGKQIGVVTDGQGQRWYEIELTGFESHAGPTPMAVRRDALLGAAKVVELVNKIALDRAPVAVGTVGMVNVHPNSRNVIPGRVFLTVDFRHPDDGVLKGMGEALEKGVAQICEAMKLDKKLEQIFYYAPTHFDEACVGLVRQAAEDLGYAHRDIVSGAGHDACYIAQVAPTAMVFCPCKDGISHNEVEDITQDWATAGANVLLRAVVAKAGEIE